VSIADELRKADRELKQLLADIGGANTPEMKAAARVLAKSIGSSSRRRARAAIARSPASRRVGSRVRRTNRSAPSSSAA
jgi:hypothetical protein